MIVANIFTDLIEELDDIAGNWWFLLVIFGIAFLDSVVPVVPSETAVILGGLAAAGDGEYNLILVIVAGASGAFLGDNFAYLLGRRFSPWIERRAATRPKLANRLKWARTQIRTRGGPLLITARFIPGGRTALTLSSGITHQRWGWFAPWVAVAAVIWASYAAALGAVFGQTFKDNHTLAFILAFAAALSITIIIEVVRHLRTSDSTSETLADAVDAETPRVG